MSLKEHLAAIKAKSTPPAEIAAVMRRTREELKASGLAEKAPQPGQKAPEFDLPNLHGDRVSSARMLEKGPLILHFFRGGW